MRCSLALALLVGCSRYSGTVPHGSPCDDTCQAPARCMTVVGMTPGDKRDECWIPCGESSCPGGLRCTMIHDGPGHVCVRPD